MTNGPPHRVRRAVASLERGCGRQAAPFLRPYGSVGVGRTLPPQMKAEIRGSLASGPRRPPRITIPGSGSLHAPSCTLPRPFFVVMVSLSCGSQVRNPPV